MTTASDDTFYEVDWDDPQHKKTFNLKKDIMLIIEGEESYNVLNAFLNVIPTYMLRFQKNKRAKTLDGFCEVLKKTLPLIEKQFEEFKVERQLEELAQKIMNKESN